MVCSLKDFLEMDYGRELLSYAISMLDHKKSIFVQTFDESIPEGKAARKLYLEFGFKIIKQQK